VVLLPCSTSPVQHLVKIDGLRPDTRYYYKVGDGSKENM
jgi:phosphodiesterase/alkaline phosphatase D-like protein